MPRPLEATLEQVLDVHRRADSGESVRAIGEAVFGDRRLKGRVERILAARARAAAVPNDPDALEKLVAELGVADRHAA